MRTNIDILLLQFPVKKITFVIKKLLAHLFSLQLKIIDMITRYLIFK
jgi:hypothetical protein